MIETSPTLPSAPSIASSGVTTSSINFTATPPTYAAPTVPIGLSSFSGYTSGLAETDPGALSITAVPPDTPGTPSISYSNASVGDAITNAVDSITVAVDSIAAAQDGISVAQDSITGAVDPYTGETDTAMTGSAAGVTDAEAPTHAAGTGSTASTASSIILPSTSTSAKLQVDAVTVAPVVLCNKNSVIEVPILLSAPNTF